MARLPDTYRAVVLDQQVQLEKLVRLAGVGPVRRLYEDMLDEVARKLRRTATGTLTHMQLRGILAQIKLGLAGVIRKMSGAFGDAAFQVGIASARSMLEDVASLEKHFTGGIVALPLMETARLRGLVAGEMPSVMRMHETTMARYGVHLVGRMEMELGASLAAAETPARAIDRVMKVGDLEWWRAERIVRTELNYSSSASSRAAADEQAVELDGDLWTRWTEHVTDDGEPLDDRVGVDSEAMHGQVAPPGGLFTQPPRAPDGEKVGDSLAERTWEHPPNRPNDRAVLVPWRVHWDIPGWVWRGGRRVPVTAAIVERANAAYQPPPRLRAAEDAAHVAPVMMSVAQARPAAQVAAEPSSPAWVQVPQTFGGGADRFLPITHEAPVAAPETSSPSTSLPDVESMIKPVAPAKNQKRVAAAKKAAQASAERRREIFSAVKSNLPVELHVAWDKEGQKFLQQQAGRIAGEKDRINAASKISQAFAETYGSGSETMFGNEGDRYFKRAEIEAQHAETWANDQEQKYYEEMKREALANGDIDDRGELTERGREQIESAKDDIEPPPASKIDDDDPPF